MGFFLVLAVGFTFHSCLILVLLLWKPTEDDPALFYVISASWGVCNAIWEMLNFSKLLLSHFYPAITLFIYLPALLTGLYSDNWESAFANSYFYRFLGFSIAFSMHSLMCNYWKFYFLSFFMLGSVLPFAWLEVKLENMRKERHIIRL